MALDFATAQTIADQRYRSLIQRQPHEIAGRGEAREALADLAVFSPGSQTADALMAVRACYPVPVDRDTLIPTGKPLTSFDAILEHYSARHVDGVALPLGRQPDGSTLVAIRATAAAWNAWLAEFCVERREVDNGEDETRMDASYRDIGRHTRVHWSPRPVMTRMTPVVVGRAALMAEGEKVRTDRSGKDQIGWVAWSIGAAWAVPPDAGKRLAFTARKLGHGVELLSDGELLPMCSVRREGWTLSCTGVPVTLDPNEMPLWLVEAFGGKWTKA